MSVKAGPQVWRELLAPVCDVWFASHSPRDWRPLLHPTALGVVLAGALVGELALNGQLVLDGDMVWIKKDHVPANAHLHLTAAHILSDVPRDLRTWVQYLGLFATGWTVERLQLAGLLVPVEQSGRLGRSRRAWVPTDSAGAGWRPARLRHKFIGDLPTLGNLVWDEVLAAALIHAGGLFPVVFGDEAALGEARLAEVLAVASPVLQQLSGVVQTLIGVSVLSAHT